MNKVQCRPFVNGDVIRLVTLDHVMGFILGSVPYIALDSSGRGKLFDDNSAHFAGFRVPSNVVAYFESC